MSFHLVPLSFKDGKESSHVMFLAEGEETPLQKFVKECRDKIVVMKIAKAIEAIDVVGIDRSKESKRLKCLNKGKGGDLYEITTKSCTARAYSYLVEDEEIVVISHIESVTHSGKGKKDTQSAIERLERNRQNLDEALYERRNNDTKLQYVCFRR